MFPKTRAFIQKCVGVFGVRIVKTSQVLVDSSRDMEPEFLSLYKRCAPFTMTSMQRMYAFYKATQYLVANKIAGDIVECGVWKGGGCMLCALTLEGLGQTDRHLYLYDTFKGMAAPTAREVAIEGQKMQQDWQAHQRDGHNDWCYSSRQDVESAIRSTGYPSDCVTYVEGKVEETIPATVPEKIALLRLDTDWYESTKHELDHLFPRLVKNGVLIIDDYGHWKGARTAVDEYFAQHATPMLLNRLDYSGRIGIKLT